MTKKLLLFFLFIACGIASCSDEGEISTDVPANIQEIMNEKSCQRDGPVTDVIITVYLWRGQQVYVVSSICPVCYSVPFLYDENGNQIQLEEGYTLDDFKEEAKWSKEIWRCSEDS